MAAKIYRAPVDAPRLSCFLTKPLGFDRAGYEKANNDYIEQVRQHLVQRKAGKHVGKIIQFPIADGYAQYMVASLRPLELVHLAVGDAWQINAIMARGLTAADVSRMVESEEEMAKIFGSRQ